MLKIFGFIIFAAAVCPLVYTLDTSQIKFVVLSQGDSHHAAEAVHLRQDILQQAELLNKTPPVVRLTHEEFKHPGAWTVIPILTRLQNLHSHNSSWVVFSEGRTRFNLARLISVLNQYDANKEMWLGHGLHDTEPTIIHHFAFAEDPTHFKYPLIAAGFAMTTKLLNILAKRARDVKSEFSIDPAHELATFAQTPLTHLPSAFCLENIFDCVSYPLPFKSCGSPVPKEQIYFAVKTCLKFHKDRIPVVKQTWGQQATRIEFFSQSQDESIPTTAVNVANTDRGHCSKTFAIFKMVLEKTKSISNLKWLVLADDDTLLSVTRLQNLLSCWKDEDVVLGERYGYNVYKSSVGYNYITGGGGIAVSISVLPTIVKNCQCLSDDSPDDMFLGFCLTRLGIQMVHSPLFHQARPNDYAEGYLATQQPVSFHKHWLIDPVAVYREWFGFEVKPHHVEL